MDMDMDMELSLLETLDETGHGEWAEMLFQNGVRRFSNLAGIEVGELMQHMRGLAFGEASELIVESRERRAARLQPGAAVGIPIWQ